MIDTDFPIFRLAEAYLIYAEAAVRTGTNVAHGAGLLQRPPRAGVREHAAADIASAAQMTLDTILAERGRELLFEGKRRTDLIRFGKFTGGSYLWAWKGNVIGGTSTDPRLQSVPLPANELTANPNLTQNPGLLSAERLSPGLLARSSTASAVERRLVLGATGSPACPLNTASPPQPAGAGRLGVPRGDLRSARLGRINGPPPHLEPDLPPQRPHGRRRRLRPPLRVAMGRHRDRVRAGARAGGLHGRAGLAARRSTASRRPTTGASATSRCATTSRAAARATARRSWTW